ncbi:hypothetical protein ACRALDRAFT_1073137 [Sodiomyces alcalophilus JCM 7366]|uniref:uncharacterized protein n=1 Tax=Sodiomyces alcalophilus JCM 7366 TaxID=591952 RepID=UPI0039B4CCB3
MASTTNSSPKIKTRFLIVSDTHGDEFPDGLKPLMSADVAIHCGDLTEESKLDEFKRSLQLLRDIDAPLNSSSSMSSENSADKAAMEREFGTFGEAERLFSEVKDSGIVLLGEGTHTFKLANGAKLTVFASPYTPSKSAGWGFQYVPSQMPSDSDGHDWSIQEGTDVVITHGPPHGILDRAQDAVRGGSQGLFAAVERSRPRLHCFGHIHEGWGARLVTWRERKHGGKADDGWPSHFTHIDNGKSATIENLAGLKAGKWDSKAVEDEKRQRLEGYRNQRACMTSHCAGDCLPLQAGEQTLFVNAAIQGESDGLEGFQLPWVVDVELPEA